MKQPTSVVLIAPSTWRVRAAGVELVLRAFAVRLERGVVVAVHG